MHNHWQSKQLTSPSGFFRKAVNRGVALYNGHNSNAKSSSNPGLSPVSPVKPNTTICLRYQYVECLGEGTTAAVHKARRISDNKLVAIKEFKRSGKNDLPSSRANVLAEFYVASRLRHRNIVQTLDLLLATDTSMILMEYVPHSLLDKMLSNSLKPPDIEFCFSQIVAGMEYLHAAGFAHRDLKLENLLLDDQGLVKIIDFGTVATSRSIRTSKSSSLIAD